MASEKRNRPTVRGFRDPQAESDGDSQPPPSPVASSDSPPKARTRLEIEVVRESGSPNLIAGPWPAVEVWTQNRVYRIGGRLHCTSVMDRLTQATVPDHPTLGSRMLGGQLRADDGRIVRVAHPFPERGMAAVFATGFGSRLRVSETSPVTRVVLRQRIVDVGSDDMPRWSEITGDEDD